MDHKVLRSLTCCILVLSLAGLVRADREADKRNEAIPPNHQMRPPVHKSIVPFASGVSPTGFTPQQLRHAYGFDKLATTGAGQTIAIVDAYGSPTIQADLNSFCATFGLPATTVAVYYPQGLPASDSDWAAETTLDVEWAHAIAPGATIAVVIAKSALSSDLLAAVDYAVGLGAKQISISWSGPEFYSEATIDYHFNVPGVSFFASSGDSGAGVSVPASSPYVVAVGGTSLFLDSSSNVSGEYAWSGGGGGFSAYQPIPAFQIGWLGGAYRNVPDVAYDADPSTGVPVYQTGVGWAQYGGTSMSAPQWAALFALANSLRSPSISSAPNALYSLATTNDAGYFRDIASGSNGLAAGPNYDLVTGLGVPVADQLVLALAAGPSPQVATPVFPPPAGVYSGAQNVTVASITPGATIRTMTLQAVASAPGVSDSPITSTVSTINPSLAYAVTKLSAPGSFFSDAFAINDNQQVTIRIQATPNDNDFAYIYRSGNSKKIADLPG